MQTHLLWSNIKFFFCFTIGKPKASCPQPLQEENCQPSSAEVIINSLSLENRPADQTPSDGSVACDGSLRLDEGYHSNGSHDESNVQEDLSDSDTDNYVLDFRLDKLIKIPKRYL